MKKKHIKFSYIVCNSFLKNTENLETEIEKLFPVDKIYENKININETEILDLYFLSGNYKKYIEIYKKNINNWDYLRNTSESSKYFYSLKQLKDFDNLKNEFEKVLEVINEEIKNIKIEDYPNDDKEFFISIENERIKEIMEIYEKILTTNYVPEVKINQKFLYDCFLKDCPLHQKYEEEK